MSDKPEIDFDGDMTRFANASEKELLETISGLMEEMERLKEERDHAVESREGWRDSWYESESKIHTLRAEGERLRGERNSALRANTAFRAEVERLEVEVERLMGELDELRDQRDDFVHLWRKGRKKRDALCNEHPEGTVSGDAGGGAGMKRRDHG